MKEIKCDVKTIAILKTLKIYLGKRLILLTFKKKFNGSKGLKMF